MKNWPCTFLGLVRMCVDVFLHCCLKAMQTMHPTVDLLLVFTVGFYTMWLLVASVFGIIVVIFGVIDSSR